jgi:hypothetical protein
MSKNKSNTTKTDAMRAQREARAVQASNDSDSESGAQPAAPRAPKGATSLVLTMATLLQKRVIAKIQKQRAKVARWAGDEAAVIAGDLDAAVGAVETAVNHLLALPADYSPRAKRVPRDAKAVGINPGDTVSIREKMRKDFEGILEDSDMVGLTVVAVSKRVIVQSKGGSRLVLKRGEFEVTARAGAV